jgi:hypothetical protein
MGKTAVRRPPCHTLRRRNWATLSHPISPWVRALIALTRCSSFRLNVNVSMLMEQYFQVAAQGWQNCMAKTNGIDLLTSQSGNWY